MKDIGRGMSRNLQMTRSQDSKKTHIRSSAGKGNFGRSKEQGSNVHIIMEMQCG